MNQKPRHIQAVIDFLNQDFNAPISTWKKFFFPHEREDGRGHEREEKFLRWEAKRIQNSLKHDIESTLKAPRKSALQKLASKCENEFVTPWPRIEAVRSGPKGRVLDFGDEKFVVYDEWDFDITEQRLRWCLRTALRTGEFSMLKKCRQCSKFFASYRRDAQACNPECNRDFHNSEGRRTGYFRRNYKLKKRERLNKARDLWKKKMSRLEIIEQSDLTELALIRAKILEPR